MPNFKYENINTSSEKIRRRILLYLMNKINWNRNIISKEKFSIGVENRAFRYGDSLFETLRVFDGRMPFISLHFNRLSEGLKLLNYDVPYFFDLDFFQHEIEKLTQKKGQHSIRFMIYRKDGGLYSPKENGFDFLISNSPLKNNKFEIPKKGLRVGILKNKILSHHYFSHLKTGNSLPYILAGQEKQKNNWADCLILNSTGNITEAISSNVFFIQKNSILTPPISSGCISGTTRKTILEQLDLPIEEKEIPPEELKNVKGILLSNSIQGIRWISSCEANFFTFPEIGERIIKKLNAMIQ